MHLKEREKLMNGVYTCPKLQKLTYFLLKKKGSSGNSGGPRSSGPRRFERQDSVKVDRRNQRFRPRVNPSHSVSNGHRESGYRDFRRKWDSSVNGFVEFGGTGTSQSHSQSHHDGGK